MCTEPNQNQPSLTPGSHLWTKRPNISKTYTEAQKLYSLFYRSHIVLHFKKYKIKLMFQERNQHQPNLTPGTHLWTNRQIISESYREAQKLNLIFDCSHIVLHLKKYKIKLMSAERNQNQESLTPGRHLWTNRPNISKSYREAQKLA